MISPVFQSQCSCARFHCRLAPPSVLYVMFEALTTVGSLISASYFKNPVTLYCFYTALIVCVNPVACYI